MGGSFESSTGSEPPGGAPGRRGLWTRLWCRLRRLFGGGRGSDKDPNIYPLF